MKELKERMLKYIEVMEEEISAEWSSGFAWQDILEGGLEPRFHGVGVKLYKDIMREGRFTEEGE